MKSLFTAVSLVVLFLQPLLAQDENVPETTDPVKVTPSDKAVMEKAATEKAAAEKAAAEKEAAAQKAATEKAAAEKAAAQKAAQKAAAEKAAAEKEAAEKANSIKTGQEPTNNSFFNSTLPWILTGTSLGSLLTLSILFYRNEKKKKDVIKKIMDGSEPTTLLTTEAMGVFQAFEKRHYDAYNKYVQDRQESYNTLTQSQRDHETTLQHFKEKHNDAMKVIAGKINEILSSSNQHASKTEEHLKTLTPLLSERAEEIQKYKEGHFHQLLRPLLSTFFDIRDDLKNQMASDAEHITSDTLKTLKSYEAEIGIALHDIGLEEISIKPGQKMNTEDHRLWEGLGAARPTNDPALHKTCVRIVKTGYILHSSNDAPDYVVRKATIEQYSSHLATPDEATGNVITENSSITPNSDNQRSSEDPIIQN
jgi:hypothetical protein